MAGKFIGAGSLRRALLMVSTVLTSIPAAGVTSEAQGQQQHQFDIPAGALKNALAHFERQSGLTVSTDPALLRGRTTGRLRGAMSADAALAVLLKNSGLDYRLVGRAVTLRKLDAFAQGTTAIQLDTVTVVGPSGERFGDIPPDGGFKPDYQSSATKMGLSIRETPQSVSVTTRESIEARQARDAVTAVELTAGVVPAVYGNSGGPFAGKGIGISDNFNVRGVDLDENRDVKFDGFPMAGSGFDLAAFERIEVVKGPAGPLYGQGSIGGFVNFIPKRPTEKPFTALASQIASFNTKRVEADAGGAATSNLRARMSAVVDDSGSFIDGVRTRMAQVAPSLEARISDSTRALFNIIYQGDNYIPSQGVPLRVRGSTASGPNIPREWFVGVPSVTDSTGSNFLGSMRVDHEFNDRWLATLNIQSGHQRIRRYFDSYGYDFTGLATGTVNMWADTALIKNNNLAGDFRLNGKFDLLGRQHGVLFGFESNRRNNRTAFGYAQIGTANIYSGNFGPRIPGGAKNIPFAVDRGSTIVNNAPYAQLLLSVTDRTKLLLSTRYDWADQTELDNLGNTGSFKRNMAQTWRTGVTHTLTQNVTAYANYGQSFNPVMDISRNGILDPQTGQGYEVGLKSEWFDKRLFASVAAYQQILDNVPIPDPTDPSGTFSISSGKQRYRGIEFEVLGKPWPGVTLGAALSFIDADYIDRGDPNFGLVPYGVVDRQTNFFAAYEIQEGRYRGLGASATLVSLGKRSLSDASNATNFGLSPVLFIDGYERVDLNFFYKGIPDWDFNFQIRNLFDEVYIERLRGISGGNFFGSPRAFLFRAQYKLGEKLLKPANL